MSLSNRDFVFNWFSMGAGGVFPDRTKLCNETMLAVEKFGVLSLLYSIAN